MLSKTNRFILILAVGLALSLALYSLFASNTVSQPNASGEENNKPAPIELAFNLPPEWEVLEEIKISDRRWYVSILTSANTGVKLETNGCGPTDEVAQVTDCMKRYVSAMLPTQEIKDQARIDLGEVNRVGLEGLYATVNHPDPDRETFTIEIYEIKDKHNSALIIINTPNTLISKTNNDINEFILSIKI